MLEKEDQRLPISLCLLSMAESFLFCIAESLIAKLASWAYEEASQVLGVHEDLQEFTRTLSFLKAVLLDADQKQEDNQELQEWLRQIKLVFSDAENLLEEVDYANLRKHVVMKAHGSTKFKVGHFFSNSNPLVIRHRMARKIKEIKNRLDRVAADRCKFSLQIIDVDRRVVHKREMTYSHVDSDVIGREHDKENIIKLLILHGNDRNLSVIPIVGIGGLGKTTLAKLVFNDTRMDESFQLKMWVCVSEGFDIKQLIVKIINSANDSNSADTTPAAHQQKFKDLDIEQLQNHLKKKLRGQKFLLIFDDVWNGSRVEWVRMRDLIQVGAVGSKILVTTRSHNIASMMGTLPSHILEGLSPEDSLSVFLKWAFKEGEEKKHPHLVNIGREIATKCGGVPLGVRTLGSLLFSKFDTNEWEYVRDNEIWNLPQIPGDILPALKLSYDQMPFYLKQCFALFSLYPKDYTFDSFDVTSLWGALGLLPSRNRNQILKNGANQYLYELLSISFIQDFVDYGIGFTFKIHYLVPELAKSVAFGDCLLTDYSLECMDSVARGVRHLSFRKDVFGGEFGVQRLLGVRTILFPIAGVGSHNKAFLDACTTSCRHLRFLDLSDSTYETLPRSIGKLKHLRYLSLENNTKIKRLPDSICNLLKLEVLILTGCAELELLPKGLGKLISLQHLELTTKLCVLPEDDIANLSSLRTLKIDCCNNLESLFGRIKLPNLRALCVAHCRSLKSLSLDIEHFPALETLSVDNCDMLKLSEVHEGQNSNSRLKVLTFVSLPQLVTLPLWLQGSLATLQYLSISSCNSLIVLPEWISAVNCLKTLCITDCPNMLSLPNDIHCLATLEHLEINGCPESLGKSQLQVGESSHKP